MIVRHGDLIYRSRGVLRGYRCKHFHHGNKFRRFTCYSRWSRFIQSIKFMFNPYSVTYPVMSIGLIGYSNPVTHRNKFCYVRDNLYP